MHSWTYRITTLGCRVNHAEARDLESILLARGLRPADAGRPADLEVVHSCTVTAAAAAKSRQATRRAARRQQQPAAGARRPSLPITPGHASSPSPSVLGAPDPIVILTGCYAGSDPGPAAGLLGGADRVISHAADAPGSLVERFAGRVDRWMSCTAAPSPIRPAAAGSSGESTSRLVPLPMVPPQADAGRHVRAELRIQDGCDAHCTFCIIPTTRPRLRSKRVADAIEEATRLVELGHPEIVLTGIFLGAYGHETALRRRQRRAGADPLADLLDAVARVPGLQRLRLSSLEPGDMTDSLLDAMVANRPVVVPHLHLPLQSGSDEILRRMNRQYRAGDYLAMIDQVQETLTDECGLPPALTTDIICGFPGETEEDFERTIEIARRVGYLHMHVFPFSPRQGTAAARWTADFLPPAIARARVRRLIDLESDPDDGLSIRYRRRLRGRTLRVILEQADRAASGWMTGRCDQYALISVPVRRPRGTLVDVTIDEVTATRTVGLPVSTHLPLPVLRATPAAAGAT
ncbi:MAG: MiaB/RimO family radical SAM methylthiotransferase [Planctomycetota bacterium]|jgi:threonylcarbamoyladenosine tRNA methylthiotransferase MtaB